MRRWRFVETPKPSISSMELAMRRDFGHGHCWGETQLEEVLHQFISCPTTDSNVFLKACFYINVVQDFFHQQVWGCIFNVWCVTLFNFVFFFLGVGGHDCRFPRKPLDEAHMHQHSNRAWNLFLCLPGIFVLGHMDYVSRCKIWTDMAVRSWSIVATFNSNSRESSIQMTDIFLMPSFWISGFTLLLPDQTSGRSWRLAPNSLNTFNRSA